MKKTLVCIMALILGASFLFAATDYRIENYNVSVVVGTDAVHHIWETINVNFEGPHHGIVREIPVDYSEYNGMTVHILDLKCSDPYEDNTDNGYYVMKIGSSSKSYTGLKRYDLEYWYDIGEDTNDGYDEFYLNIIGTDWECPIDEVNFTVEIPFVANREFPTPEAFEQWVLENTWITSGRWGSTDLEFVEAYEYQLEDGTIVIEGFAEGLDSYEGVTMRLELPEGWITGAREKWDYRLLMSFLNPIVTGVLLAVAVLLWSTFGKDNIPIIDARFKAPKDMSPLMVGYVADSIVDDKDVISMLFYWADQGLLSIEEQKGGKFEFTKLKEIMDYAIESGRNIPKMERKLFDGFFKNCGIGDKVTFRDLEKNNFYGTIQETKVETMAYFKKDRSLVSGKSLVLAVLVALSSFIPLVIGTMRIGLYENASDICFVPFVAGIILLFWNILMISNLFRKWYLRKSNVTASVVCALPTVLVVLLTYAVEVVVNDSGSLSQVAISVIGSTMVCLFGIITEKRSKYGDQVLEEILGYREFIEKVEIDQLKMMIDEDPMLYYHVLSYAIVLGLEDKWAKKFKGMIVPEPSWYRGYDAFDVYYMSRMASRMYRTLPAASVPKSSVSGSAGSRAGGSGFHSSGFSGGGFGGGGGHAW